MKKSKPGNKPQETTDLSSPPSHLRAPLSRCRVISTHPDEMEAAINTAIASGWRLVSVAARRESNDHVAYLVI